MLFLLILGHFLCSLITSVRTATKDFKFTPFLPQNVQYKRIFWGNFHFYPLLGCFSTILRQFYPFLKITNFWKSLVNQLIVGLPTPVAALTSATFISNIGKFEKNVN